MSSQLHKIQEETLFSKSRIWQINRDFYHQKGIAAWSDEIVPHQITNSSLAATTYAELIYAFLKDLELKDKSDTVVYILELGAGHGRLSFNILEHLDRLILAAGGCSIKYCYVLSDIVEDNLTFYESHPKLQKYYDRGVLDISYFDAIGSRELELRKSKKTITSFELEQPILAIANYFFDTLPNELFYFQSGKVFNCKVSIDSSIDPEGKSAQELIQQMELTFQKELASEQYFENAICNQILSRYNQLFSGTYILFPHIAMECLSNISSLSQKGLVTLTMDKGYKEIHELASRERPDVVRHGSFSLWVNFHAISEYCELKGGSSNFDPNTNLSIELGVLNFTKQQDGFHLFEQTYSKHTSQLNLDDFNSMKKLVYKNLTTVDLSELLGLIRLSAYDSSIFIHLLPTIKKLSKNISLKQRSRLGQSIGKVWNRYYAIKEDYDLSYELGGLLYDLGYYAEALVYFKYSSTTFGHKIDVDYNQILCYYQLREDTMFYKSLNAAVIRFPNADVFKTLRELDMK